MSVLDRLVSPATSHRKAATGRGVTMMETGTPLASLLSDDPRKRAAQAIGVWRSNLWVRAAERTISSRLGVQDWWLTDEAGDKVTDESPEPLIQVRDTLARPYTPAPGDPVTSTPTTFRGLRAITSRHMGVVGHAFWYLDQTDALDGTPLDIIYIHPARMLPVPNAQGALVGWVMDAGTRNPVSFELDEVLVFNLEEPDTGYLGAGLVESAIRRLDMTRLADSHANYVLASGGRRAGIYTPRSDTTIGDQAFTDIQRDLRAAADLPDAAKRSLVLRGPVDFQETSSTPSELDLVDLADLGRDGVLALWGVPRSQLGMDVPAGLNSGATKDKDEEVLWNNAIGPRHRNIRDTINLDLLPRYGDTVGRLAYDAKEPTYDDDQPRYAMAATALQQPLRNVERRAILGLEPTGDPAIDDAVWLPVGLIEAYSTPPHDPQAVSSLAKASIVNPRLSKQFAAALHTFLVEQGKRLGAKVERQSAAIKRKPNDDSPYWNEAAENAALFKVMAPYMVEEMMTGSKVATKRLAGKAAEIPAGVTGVDIAAIDPFDFFNDTAAFDDPTVERAMRGIGNRVKQVNASTHKQVISAIQAAVEGAMESSTSPAELGRMLRGVVEPLPGDKVAEELARTVNKTFASEYRAETIARTELRMAQNAATLDTYRDAGIYEVRMIDGVDDPECAARNGQVVSADEAAQHALAEHPNGTLDFAPVV